MYLVKNNNKTKGYLSLSRLMKEEGIDKSLKTQLSAMLDGNKVLIGLLIIEKIEVDERI